MADRTDTVFDPLGNPVKVSEARAAVLAARDGWSRTRPSKAEEAPVAPAQEPDAPVGVPASEAPAEAPAEAEDAPADEAPAEDAPAPAPKASTRKPKSD